MLKPVAYYNQLKLIIFHFTLHHEELYNDVARTLEWPVSSHAGICQDAICAAQGTECAKCQRFQALLVSPFSLPRHPD